MLVREPDFAPDQSMARVVHGRAHVDATLATLLEAEGILHDVDRVLDGRELETSAN
jgi:hypothetical protein